MVLACGEDQAIIEGQARDITPLFLLLKGEGKRKKNSGALALVAFALVACSLVPSTYTRLVYLFSLAELVSSHSACLALLCYLVLSILISYTYLAYA